MTMKKSKEKNDILTIAAAKGYLLEGAVRLFEKIGIVFDEDLSKSRKLFAIDTSNSVRLLQVRPWDVSVYVEQGAADLGIVGKDVLYEKDDQVIRLLDLLYGECRLVLAGLKKVDPKELKHNIVVATKYPNSMQAYFKQLGIKARTLKLYGAVELAPLTGLADLICDLTASGQTLEENKLHILDTVFHSSAVLIANQISMKFQYPIIKRITQQLREVLKQ
ncbi:ATP phosphoribosyltransferase [Thermoproteota archaeon]